MVKKLLICIGFFLIFEGVYLFSQEEAVAPGAPAPTPVATPAPATPAISGASSIPVPAANTGTDAGSIAAQSATPSSPPSVAGADFQYYVAINGQQNGPYGEAELRQLVTNGQLTADTFIWGRGMPQWARAGSVGEFAPILSNLPLPRPQPAVVIEPEPVVETPVNPDSVPGALEQKQSNMPAWIQPFGIRVGIGAVADTGWGGIKTSSFDMKIEDTSFGAFIFGDFTYAVVDVAYKLGSYNRSAPEKYNANEQYLSVSMLGKFPFLAGRFVVYPLLGVENTYYLKMGSDSIAKGYNNIFLRVGAGVDISISSLLFVRVNLLWGLRQAAASELKVYETYRSAGGFEGKLHHSFQAKVAVGFNLPI